MNGKNMKEDIRGRHGIVNLPALLVQGIATVTGNDLTGRI